MGQKRVIGCDVEGCKESRVEETFGMGWPDWGGILKGKQNDETGETNFYLCPHHLNLTFQAVFRMGQKEEN